MKSKKEYKVKQKYNHLIAFLSEAVYGSRYSSYVIRDKIRRIKRSYRSTRPNRTRKKIEIMEVVDEWK